MSQLPGQAGMQPQANPMPTQSGAMTALPMTGGPIGKPQIVKAMKTLREYKEGKAQLEKRVIASEEWYRLRSWEEMEREGGPTGNEYDRKTRSAWLFNVLMGKQADAIEAYPEPRILPRMQDDKDEAAVLTKIVPLVIEQNGFEQTYSDNSWKKLRSGTSVYGIFWDKNRHNGLGDVAIKKVDLLNLFWEPGVTDIQESRNFFHAELVCNELLEEQYPQLAGKLKKGGGSELSKYRYDDNVPTNGKSLVVDWYYKRRAGGRNVLHYCKFVGDQVLFASENDPNMAERGWYDDGDYPYEFDALFPIEGSPAGIGYIDIGKSPQESIDLLGQQLVKNAVMGATPRHFIDDSGAVNEEEYADWTKPFVHVKGAITPTNIVPIQIPQLGGNYISIYQTKLEEMKFTTGNQDVLNGGTGGMTTASGQAAAQEAAGRSSKASTKGTYRAYARIVNKVIERIRQFYDVPRAFRILGEQGIEQYIMYSNQRLQQQPQGAAFGMDLGFRLPVFDVHVQAAKQTPFSRQAQNDLAVQLFSMGVFNPQAADQVVPMLDIMDFPGKDDVLSKVMQNQTMLKQLQLMTQIVMQLTDRYEPEKMPALLQMLGIQPPGQPGQAPQRQAQAPAPGPEGGRRPGFTRPNPEDLKEHGTVRKAREQAQNVAQPD